MPASDPAVIRIVRPGDAPGLRELRIEALRTCPTAFCSDPAEAAAKPIEWWGEHASNNSGDGEEALFVAEIPGRLVAMAGIYSTARPKQAHRATIWGVYVRPEARGRGICATLIDAAVRWAIAKQKVLVDLAVTAGNDTALRCYERAGFAPYGRQPLVIRVDGVYFDEWLMAKRL